MDYPITVPNVALLDGKFTDGDPGSGVPASLDPSEWANNVTDEILNVQAAAGLTNDETNAAQLVQAIKILVNGADIRGVYASGGSPTVGTNAYVRLIRVSVVAPTGGAIVRADGWLVQAFSSGAKNWGLKITVDSATDYSIVGDNSTLPPPTTKALIFLTAGSHNIDLMWLGQDGTISTALAFLDIFGAS